MRRWLLLSALLFTACDPFAAAQKEDSVEAWEAFLRDNPSSPWRPQAQDRLEVLLFEAAKEENTLPAYDAWLERFPSSSLKDEVKAAREGSLFRWAADQNSVEAWDAYMGEYPDSRRRAAAERGRRVAQNGSDITIAEPRAQRTNLAEDPEGPLNGWLIEADVTNTGRQAYKTVILRPTAPEALETLEWPVAAARWTLPLTEEQQKPLGAGETRTWAWSTDELPEDWSGEVTLILADIGQ